MTPKRHNFISQPNPIYLDAVKTIARNVGLYNTYSILEFAKHFSQKYYQGIPVIAPADYKELTHEAAD